MKIKVNIIIKAVHTVISISSTMYKTIVIIVLTNLNFLFLISINFSHNFERLPFRGYTLYCGHTSCASCRQYIINNYIYLRVIDII